MNCRNSCRRTTVGFVAAVLALAAVIYLVGLALPTRAVTALAPNEVPRAALDSLFSTRFADAGGTLHSLDRWRGQTLVVNFWAAWCTPCREEMPAFSRLQRKYAERDVQFVGLAVDSAKNVSEFNDRLAVDYPLLIAEADGGPLMQQLGNQSMGLPYTIVIAADGSVAMTRLGRMPESTLDDLLEKSVPRK